MSKGPAGIWPAQAFALAIVCSCGISFGDRSARGSARGRIKLRRPMMYAPSYSLTRPSRRCGTQPDQLRQAQVC